MEAAGLALSAAQTLLAALGCPQLQHIFSIWGYRSELQSLQRTVFCVQAVLLDVQSRDQLKLTHFECDTIQKLKDALYEADDLLDEFATLARQHEISDDKFLGKVRRLFPRFNKLKIVYKMSKEVNNIRNKLDQTTKEAALFGFKVKLDDRSCRVFSRDETHSYANSIVGREEDKRRIVDMLLDPNVLEDVFVLTVVGVGGLGKTTLAQIVYNDQRIQAEFRRRIWVCVSDQDQNKPDQGKMILAKILKSASVETHTDNLTYDSIVQQLRKKLSEEKYILVLDDVWTEDPVQSREWLNVLRCCANSESRIIVTTRSKGTAIAVSSNHVYELQGLSNEYSWSLFEMVVGREQANRPDLIEMGRNIVKKCANVPLAIKVLGSLLRGQDKSKWRSFHRSKLNEIRKGESGNNIMEILKFSYNHLSPTLKTCFAYCAMFPKDSKIRKEKLLRLWMAQGYVKPLDGGQVIEEAAEEYFRILVQRCFFQDVEWDDDAEEIRFKIHDLMHDIAQEVAGNEVFVGGASDPSSLDKRVRHFFDDQPGIRRANNFVTRSAVRSYVHGSVVFSFPRIGALSFPGSGSQFPVTSLLANWKCLRALDLSNIWTDDLPYEIGELLHLRYIDLSGNCLLKMLPESFTKLINLEILILDGCSKLKELPKGFNKLVNLRTLSVCGGDNPNGYGWHGLRYMPSGMEKLTSLCHLNGFVVANRESNMKHNVGGLRELKCLLNLRGCLEIWIPWGYRHVKEDSGDGYLSNKKYLSDIHIQFCNEGGGETSEEDMNSDEAVLEDLMPHPNLEVMIIQGYKGVKLPSWSRQNNLSNFLPNLVKIFFDCIAELQELPYLSKLPCLKVLEVSEMASLMYMENITQEYSSSSFFPSLEELCLQGLPNLEGWWKTIQCRVPSFPHLSRLCIKGCPKLVSFPLCPTIEKLLLQNFDERLQIMTEEEINPNHGPKLRYLETDFLKYLGSLPTRALQSLEKIRVDWDANVENLSEVGDDAIRSCSSSLQSLEIFRCSNLRSVSGGLKHLTALNSLVLLELPKLSLEENELEDDILQRGSFLASLKSLTIDAGNLVAMLRVGCFLSSLQSLYVTDCANLESLPEGMKKLTSLRFLVLEDSSANLKRRCREPDGEDWSKIQHIRQVQMREEDKYDRFLAFILDLPPRAHLSKSMGYRKTKWENLHGYGIG